MKPKSAQRQWNLPGTDLPPNWPNHPLTESEKDDILNGKINKQRKLTSLEQSMICMAVGRGAFGYDPISGLSDQDDLCKTIHILNGQIVRHGLLGPQRLHHCTTKTRWIRDSTPNGRMASFPFQRSILLPESQFKRSSTQTMPVFTSLYHRRQVYQHTTRRPTHRVQHHKAAGDHPCT